MPAQSFCAILAAAIAARWSRRALAGPPILTRLVVFGGALALTAYGADRCSGSSRSARSRCSNGCSRSCSSPISPGSRSRSPPASSASSGCSRIGRPSEPAPRLRERTAVVMPIYNEAPSRVFGAMQAIFEDVERDGPGACVRLLPALRHHRPRCLDRRGARVPGAARAAAAGAPLLPHRGARTSSRKAGNIADFVTRWGGAYPHMVVLDADSLMTGACDRQPRGRDGGRPRRRHHPDAAADHQPQHAVRAPAAVRRPDPRPGHRGGPERVDGARRQLLGPQRHHPHRAPSRPIAACRTCAASRRSAATSSATISSRRR